MPTSPSPSPQSHGQGGGDSSSRMGTWCSEFGTCPSVGFRVLPERADAGKKTLEVLTPQLIPARGNSLVGADYEFLDSTPGLRGMVSYYLEDIDIWGRVTRHGPVAVQLEPGRSRTR